MRRRKKQPMEQVQIADAKAKAKGWIVLPGHGAGLGARGVARALAAATPGRRGRKVRRVDPKVADLEERLRKAEREKELIPIRARDLEEMNAEIRSRGLDRDRKR